MVEVLTHAARARSRLLNPLSVLGMGERVLRYILLSMHRAAANWHVVSVRQAAVLPCYCQGPGAPDPGCWDANASGMAVTICGSREREVLVQGLRLVWSGQKPAASPGWPGCAGQQLL